MGETNVNEQTRTGIVSNYRDAQGQIWDLNDPETYVKSWFPDEHLLLDAHGLHKAVCGAIGFSLYYMTCCHPDTDWEGQRSRVIEFGKHFARESREPDRYENAAWLRKQLFLILDETENQC